MLIKTLFCKSPGLLEYNSSDTPQLRKDQAISKVKRVGICGTDLHAFEGTPPFFNYPKISGHELAGELIEFDTASVVKEVSTDNNKITYSFPPHSFTQIKITTKKN